MPDVMSARWHWRFVVAACFAFAWIAQAAPPAGAAPPPLGNAPSSSKAAKQDAIRAMPLNQLTRQERASVEKIIRKASLYRRMPTEVIDCDPELFTHFIQNPHVIANMWEVLGISKLKLTVVDKTTFKADDGNGTLGTMRILKGNYGKGAQNTVLLYGEGTYEAKTLRIPIKAKVVMLLRSGSVRETNGKFYVSARLDSFIFIDQVGLDLLAKTFHPLLGKTADQNFVETMRFVESYSKAAERSPRGVARLADRMKRINAEERKQLVMLAYAAHKRLPVNMRKTRTTRVVPASSLVPLAAPKASTRSPGISLRKPAKR